MKKVVAKNGLEISHRLNKNEDIYRQMFKFSLFPILIHDLEMNIIDANDKAISEFGYSKKELLKKTVLELHCETELEHSFQVLEEMKVKNTLNIETKFKRKDGSFFIAEATPKKYILGDKTLIHVLIQDITQRKNNEINLIKAKRKAEESERLKSTFLANMSHEIRTPMNAILGFASLLNEREHTLKQVKKYTEIISTSGEHLLSIINNIIDISKIEAGEISINKSNIDLNKLLTELYNFFHSHIVSKRKLGINLKMKIPPSSLFISTDQTRLRQILINLIGNSVKFTEKGEIEFGYKLDDNNILFFVKDTGIGIAKNKQKLIFKRFQQATESTEKIYGGAGLGLAIAKACVELLGGNIWFETEEDKGTSFYFKIRHIKGVKDSSYSKLEKNNAYRFNNELILIAEDDNYNYEYLKTILEKYNLRHLRTSTGRETIKKALKHDDLDLILMDIQMPDLSGIDATIEIIKQKPTLPIIAQTAYAYENDKEKILKAGCIEHISKPINEYSLLNLIHENLNKTKC